MVKQRSTNSLFSFARRLRFEPLEERRLLSITVNTLIDESDGSIGDGDVSLRDAIALAPAGEVIDFSVQGAITLTLGQLVINKNLTIDGPGAGNLTISGNNASRILLIDNGNSSTNAAVEISGLTLAHGRIVTAASGDLGGAILSRESLILDAMAIIDNFAENEGGGVYASASSGGQIAVRNSLITGNRTNWGGGGAYVVVGAGVSMTIENNTFSYNQSGLQVTSDGGGLEIRVMTGGSATVTGSTFSSNRSHNGNGGGIAIRQGQDTAVTLTGLTVSNNQAVRGGGINIFATIFSDSVTISHSTVTGNKTNGTTTSFYGGGISAQFTSLMLNHTIVAGNQAGASRDIRVQNGTIGAQYSLVGDNTGSGLAAAPVGSPDANGNLVGISTGIIDARLAPLADNGGPTKVHALFGDSPALDAGNPAFVGPPNFDQRGAPYARVVDGNGVGGAGSTWVRSSVKALRPRAS